MSFVLQKRKWCTRSSTPSNAVFFFLKKLIRLSSESSCVLQEQGNGKRKARGQLVPSRVAIGSLCKITLLTKLQVSFPVERTAAPWAL